MIIPTAPQDTQQETSAHAPSLDDIASLRLEMRASFHEISERCVLLEMEQSAVLRKFDALLALVNDAVVTIRG